MRSEGSIGPPLRRPFSRDWTGCCPSWLPAGLGLGGESFIEMIEIAAVRMEITQAPFLLKAACKNCVALRAAIGTHASDILVWENVQQHLWKQ
ncbi:hypothetical protein GRJ2_000481900 [Grus japonensis]|uniref:Uncharacterized protein n=1 Tax=Grus japonensis TaxID=30415 RepID=A0ABC9W4B1_GRUJA